LWSGGAALLEDSSGRLPTALAHLLETVLASTLRACVNHSYHHITMASYFQSYFQASSMPKRLLQYALSRLDILDTDALNLENLDIAWGKNSTFEFRDVGLHLKVCKTPLPSWRQLLTALLQKLDALLQLPPSLEFAKAKVLLLRLTVPVDIFSSPILVEVDGVESHLRVKATPEKQSTFRTDHDRIRKQPSSRGSVPSVYAKSHTQRRRSEFDEETDLDAAIPTAEDLAQSFLQAEPEEERAELEAAILSETQEVGSSSVLSEDGDVPMGTGTTLSLPVFMAKFLQGIVDRLQVRIHGICINLHVDIPSESPKLQPSTDPVSIQLRVEDIHIEGVTYGPAGISTSDEAKPNMPYKEGKRLICLSNIRGYLVSEANFFSSLAHSSALSSPSMAHTEAFERKPFPKAESTVQESVMSLFDEGSSPEDEIASSRISVAASSKTSSRSHILAASVVTSDYGRFEDAPEDDDTSIMSESARLSEAGDSVFQNSAYLDQVTESQYASKEGLEQALTSSAQNLPSSIHAMSLRSTPSASMHIPGEETDHLAESTLSSYEQPLKTILQSTILPSRQHSRFSDGRVSQSQPYLSADPISAPQDYREIHQDISTFGKDTIDNVEESDEDEDSPTPLGEDLIESRLFSHEDAESMYMSAISRTSSRSSIKNEQAAVNSETPLHKSTQGTLLDNLENARHSSPIDRSPEPEDLTHSTASVKSQTMSRSLSNPSHHIDEAPDKTPLPRSTSGISEHSVMSSDEYSRLSKQIFNLDIVRIYLPALNTDSPEESDLNTSHSTWSSPSENQVDTSRSTSFNIPGAFSTYQSTYRPSRPPPVPAQPKRKQASDTNTDVEVVIGHLLAQFDVSIVRLAFKLVDQLKEVFKHVSTNTPNSNPSNHPNPSKPTNSKLGINIHEISARFLERLEGTLDTEHAEFHSSSLDGMSAADVLLRASLKGLQVDTTTADSMVKTSMTLQKFSFGYSQENILSFDSGLQMGASVRDLKADAGIDVTVDIVQGPGTTRCEINTLPMHVSIDLQRLDETFSWFGGLSSVLNLGSSMASNTTVTGSPTKPKPRGVRFEAPIRPDDKSVVSQNKADVRIGGFMLDLVGAECWIGARTSAVKLVNRDEGIGVTIQKIRLTGPHLRQRIEDPAIIVDITGTRVEYHPSPKTGDLDLLLSLITPSRAKYDQDDDILLDTLLRQRKQGSVLRLTIDDFQSSISKLHELSHLPELGEEVARLATVAKYLPDDDRPGLLSLISVSKFASNIDFNNTIGTLQLASTDINIAQITLPALIALSIGSVSARRNVSEELLGFVTDPDLREENAPAIMARMIGDEMEPIVRVKLWNLKIEYRVPTLMVLLGLAQDATTQDITASLTASVATLTDLTRSKPARNEARQLPVSPTSKPLTVDIVLRDCILGLNPLGLPSKMLVVLTEARSTIVLPKDGNSNASLDLNQASILIVDNVAHLVSTKSNSRIRRQSSDGAQVADLCTMGYVSVSYISSAKAIVQVTKSEDQETSIDVELRDDLFVLESCADSTQTMIAILNGLSPPTPPSKEIKYRTKVIPVHDLLASLSGDAFGTAQGTYNIEDDFGFALAESEEGEGGEEFGYDVDSQYLQNEGDDGDDLYNEAILEDEGQSIASMHLTSQDTKDGVLLASFVEPVTADEPIDLNFQEDHFGTGSVLEGTAHRWNSAKNTYDRSNTQKIRRAPLKVCVRDVHIIWNLFDGYDWQHTRDAITKAVQDVESKAIEKRARNERRPTFDQDIEDDETVIGDFLFNSIYIGIPAHREPGDLSAAVNFEINDDATETESIATTTVSASPSRQGSARRPKSKKLRLHRSRHHKIAFELQGVSVDVVAFPPGSGETQSSIDIRVRDFEIFDHVPTSTWRKFATYMQDAGERETGTSMIHIEILNVKPVPDLAAAEIVLKATVLPLRLHVDQDALDFITRFFEFKDDAAPVQSSAGDPPFLQRVEVNAVQVKLDFKPKRVDYAGLRSGHTTEFMNFLILDEADMVLRHTIIYGISGFEKLGKCLNDIWMPDIKRNQLPGILAGLAPVRSLVNVGGGLRHLVVVPMREYKKDGRIVRSISKGAAAFAKTTGTELVKLGAKVAIGVQTVLQGAEDFLGPPGENRNMADGEDEEISRQISHYANQPVGVLQGLKGGYAGLQRDLVLARDAIIAVPGEVMEGGNAAGVLRAVRKHAPTVILRPAMGVATGLGQVLMGATNSLDPQNIKRAGDVSFNTPFASVSLQLMIYRNIRIIDEIITLGVQCSDFMHQIGASDMHLQVVR
jgi:autophagy-related protein 2